MNHEAFLEAVARMTPEAVAGLTHRQCAALRFRVALVGVLPEDLEDAIGDVLELARERQRALRGGECECGLPYTITKAMTHEQHMPFHQEGAQR